jgi:hypothetical protein
MNYIDTMMSKTISWIDQMFSFVNQYSQLFVYGFIFLMAAKLFKIKINYSNK